MKPQQERTSNRNDEETAEATNEYHQQRIYTATEAALVLKVHPNTVYELCRRKRLAHGRIGRQIRIAEDAIDELLHNETVPTQPLSVGQVITRR